MEHFKHVKESLSLHSFSEFVWVLSRPTIADLYKPDKRCGIYVLRFRNEQYYVGQTVDIIRRYIQHSRVHNDIQEIAFKDFHKIDLNKIEEELIKILESKNVLLRNISLTSIPKGESDLDLIIPKEEQQSWLLNNITHELQTQIINDPSLHSKHAKKVSQLINRPDFKTSVYPFLIEYLKKCVIQPAKTELSFWSLTCLVKAFRQGREIALCRINFYWCETIVIWLDNENNLNYNFHLTKSLLTDDYLNSLNIKSLTFNDHYYIKGGPDQFKLSVKGIEDALLVLKDSRIISAIKTFNLRLMQKGATVYGIHHCIDLAKYLLDPITKKTS